MTTREEAIRLANEATDNQPLYGRKEFTFSFGELERLIQLTKNEAFKEAAQVGGPEDSYRDEWFNAKADSANKILALVKE